MWKRLQQAFCNPSVFSIVLVFLLFCSNQVLRDSAGIYGESFVWIYIAVAVVSVMVLCIGWKDGVIAKGALNRSKLQWSLYMLLVVSVVPHLMNSHLRAPQVQWLNSLIVHLHTAAAVVFIVSPPQLMKRFSLTAQLAFGAGFGMLVISFLLVPVCSPNPAIDVLVFHREGAQALLAGLNPYEFSYTNIYGPTPWYPGGVAKFQPYPPLSVIFSTIGHLLGDPRFVSVFFHILGSLLLYLRLRQKGFEIEARYLTGLWLLFPRSHMVIEQGWTDVFVMGTLMVIVFLSTGVQKAFTLVCRDLCWGVFFALKQTNALFAFPVLYFYRKQLNVQRFILVLIPIFISFLPFLVWNPAELWRDLVWFHAQTPFRKDGITISSLLIRNGYEILPGIWSLLAYLVLVGLYLLKKVQSLSFLLFFFSTVYLVVLLLSKHAFFNYIYTHYMFLLMALAAYVFEVVSGQSSKATSG